MTNGMTDRPAGLARLRSATVALLAAVWLCLGAVAAGQANAALDITSFTTSTSDTTAGGHPDLGTSFMLGRDETGWPLERIRDMIIDMPPGVVGNVENFPACPARLYFDQQSRCPLETQVGGGEILIALDLDQDGIYDPHPLPAWIHKIEAPENEPARLGVKLVFDWQNPDRPPWLPVQIIRFNVRTGGDYGLDALSEGIASAKPIVGMNLAVWGVPFDHTGAGERRPFMSGPTNCADVPWTRIRANSYENPLDWDSAEHAAPIPTDCENVAFNPRLEVTPHSTQPDAPSGYTVDLRVPFSNKADGVVQSHLRRAVVTMPDGVTMSPSAADGLQACSDGQIALDSKAAPSCPEASKIGTVTIDTPLLAQQMKGSIYVGSQLASERYRIFVVAEGAGVTIKLKGSVSPDPQTGRLTTTFENNPQLPFEHMRLEFKGGPRAPLANPPTCGTKTVTSELTPWSGNPPATPSTSFAIDCPGVAGFAPALDAGTLAVTGGAFSPFALRIERPDGQQYLSGVQVDMPGGLLAKLRGVPLCRSNEAANGGCPAGSRIGTATVGSGPGSNPFFLKGDVFLTEGYKGAPYGMAVHVHAKAGPYDLGWVRVRQAIHVDPATAELTVVSDPLPQILEGIPVRLRSVNVDVDRPGFTVNPTSCAQKEIVATLTSIDGTAHRAVRSFRAGGCKALPFKPRIGLALKGRTQTTTGRHPAIHAVVRQRGLGEAGIDRAEVRLPKALALDPDNAQALCEFEDGTKPDLENHCPKGSIVGRARAVTPLLERPLVGNVYFVKNVRRDPRTGNPIRTLPMIVAALRGEIAINLRGESDSTDAGRLVNTFRGVPDAPITRFNLNIKGGRNGILAVTGSARGDLDVCRGRQIANAYVDGQNGRVSDYAIRVKTPCKAKRAAKGKRRARRGGRR